MKVDQYNSVVQLLQQMAASQKLYFIARIQYRNDLSVQINNGKTEEINTAILAGIGIQVFNESGYMGFAASDQVSDEIAQALFEKAALLAEWSQKSNGETNREIFKAAPFHKQMEISLKYPVGTMHLSKIEAKLKELNQEIMAIDSRLSVRTILRVSEEEWRICRSDGTDVKFNTPRSFVFHSITAKSAAQTTTTAANLPGNDLGVIIEPEKLERLTMRARKAANLAIDLLDAANFPGGNYKMVIDYGLAKGLAHEAFGHAAETDSLDSSILGEDGRLKTGMKVADPRLSIIDGPLEGDYAYQPVSAVGIERKTVKIVDQGILQAGLADIFSAAKAGVEPTGAERVESFFHLPIARMSNIRIEFEGAFPLNQTFENITPLELYRNLRKHRLIEDGEKVIYLSGFKGGQVNPAFGDFVFNCAAIYDLSENPVLYKPAIFSGKILSVLQSVSAALGNLQIDVMGTCGKMGQGVPSCGGSHFFLLIDKNPDIMIGGE